MSDKKRNWKRMRGKEREGEKERKGKGREEPPSSKVKNPSRT